VDRVILGTDYIKPIERLTIKQPDGKIKMPWSGERARKREIIAKRAAKEIEPHSYVNIGVGIPTMVSNFVTSEGVTFHSENGIVGLGGYPDEESKVDRECINAS